MNFRMSLYFSKCFIGILKEIELNLYIALGSVYTEHGMSFCLFLFLFISLNSLKLFDLFNVL